MANLFLKMLVMLTQFAKTLKIYSQESSFTQNPR